MKALRATLPRVGSIVAIPLPGKRIAFGRLYRDSSIGIFDRLSYSQAWRPRNTDRELFVLCVFTYAITSGEWPVVGYLAFATPQAEWPPIQAVPDPITSERRHVYHLGEIRRPTSSEAAHIHELELAGISKPEQLVERLVRHAHGLRLSKDAAAPTFRGDGP